MYPKAFIEYLAHFHGTRDYFECHEVLEDHWKKTEPGNRKSVWVCLIQLAVSLYHFRRGNLTGAYTLINRTLEKLKDSQKQITSLGIQSDLLIQKALYIKSRIVEQKGYISVDLPLSDPALLKEVKQLCLIWGVSYGTASDLTNLDLIDKHKRRRR
ncbi:DUF309 domain-containing protein [Halobacillus shinanisalinarum]|uniref:DUF309 domain-containing protein n=1 Tax=Halobacillus shinanisalinarum TaxID=2932258 RepID=A0ABY4H1W4_9BACI|nr:DUF309 domain-containing protein [Halobacillus shinanisalinarum]UOQ93632.1 DUF309 domain-containing protein [Halobacillus shinanisalinarum]